MLIKNIDMLITKVDLKKNSKTNEPYILVSLLSLSDGSTFDIVDKEIEHMKDYKPMCKFNLDLNLNGTKYGLQLTIDKINKELGGI